jgi:uncharacterized protein (TIGR02284 family)
MRRNTEDISVMNDLIETLKDGENGFREAAEAVRDSQLASLFEEYSQQRAQFAAELQMEVGRLGGNPERSGSTAGALHRGWIDLKAAIAGNNESQIISECERGEDAAKEAYERALQKNLSTDIRIIVQSQAEQIKEAHDRIRSLELALG